MAKKKLNHHQKHQQLSWFLCKMLTNVSLFLCLMLYLHFHQLIHHTSTNQSPLPRSSPSRGSFQGTPKIAFLFLAKRRLPLDFLWNYFFRNADADKFSVYVHSEPGFLLNETTTDSAFFHGRQLNRSVQVVWGEPTMIQAEKLLLQAALHDPANQRFVLLSDSCIPLYNFSYTYSYIMSSPKSFVDSFVDESTGRYNPDMSTTIPRSKWRKGSQWVTLVRKHADVVVNDNFVYTVFRKYCKRWKARRDLPRILRILDLHLLFQHQQHSNCIPDEHYVQTLLTMNELEHELERRTLTYTEWDSAPTKDWRQTWHPVTFDQPDSVTEKIKEIKGINNVHYESEHRTEWCKVANIFSTCFLFARKFSQGAAVRLLNDDAVALFDPEAASLSSSA
ncbi:Glycosyltransferase BC10 [Linum perenne]